ncbi:MAG: hypothetical protein HXK76_02730 [Lachnoanaerobaculum sp.]|nr:hypothetical protein [Lachnoanaerobaculum sp.]
MKTDNRMIRNNGTELIRLMYKAISCCRWRANFALSNASDYRKWKEKKKVLEDALEIVKEIRKAI